MFQIFYLFFTTIETSLFVFTIYRFSKMLVATKILCDYIFCNIVLQTRAMSHVHPTIYANDSTTVKTGTVCRWLWYETLYM